jgi:hypothetical protein
VFFSVAEAALRAALIAALERHLLVYGAGGEKEARRLIAEIADEVLKEVGENGWEVPSEPTEAAGSPAEEERDCRSAAAGSLAAEPQ